MIKRVLTAVLGIPLLIIIINQGGLLLFVALSTICSIGIWEYCKSINRDKEIKINTTLEIVLGLLLLYILKYQEALIIPGITVSFITIFVHEIIQSKVNIIQGIYAFFGLIYIPFLLGHIFLFQNFDNGKFVLALIFIICFSTDTFAYIVGINFGKHKLCPLISPNKSVEGAIGGIIASVVITLIYGYFMMKLELLYFNWSYYIILSLFTSVIAQFGDLTASMIKRTFEVKDFGNILPGHGGVLDRFDSIIFATPVIYYITAYYISLF